MSYSYEMRNIDNCWVLYQKSQTLGFESVLNKRRTWGKERFNTQIERNRKVDITDIGTATFIVADLKLKNGDTKRVLVAKSRKKKLGEYAFTVGGYVDFNKARGVKFWEDHPFEFVAKEEIDEELLFFRKIDMAWMPVAYGSTRAKSPTLGFEFDEQAQPHIRATRYVSGAHLYYDEPVLWRSQFPWVKTMEVLIPGKDGERYAYEAMIDTRHNNLQVCQFWKLEVNLSAVKICASETHVGGDGYLYDEYFDGQGAESTVIFLDFDNPFGGQAWKPDCNSDLGIVEIPRPYGMSEMFFSRLSPEGIAYTDGDWPSV